MSKSLGNFFLIRDILARYPAEVVRYFLLGSHYRGPLDYSDAELDNAKASLERLYLALADLPPAPAQAELSQAQFHAALQDDLNTPAACAVLHDLARQVNIARQTSPETAAPLAAALRELGGLLGLLQADPRGYLQAPAPADTLSVADIEAAIAQRQAARKAKDFAAADRLRAVLLSQGVLLEDHAQGTNWRRE
jgi:cysteinyl-tRNA synthetase